MSPSVCNYNEGLAFLESKGYSMSFVEAHNVFPSMWNIINAANIIVGDFHDNNNYTPNAEEIEPVL
eukprot:15365424-Ditylum_brightwellii.AAC.1